MISSHVKFVIYSLVFYVSMIWLCFWFTDLIDLGWRSPWYW